MNANQLIPRLWEQATRLQRIDEAIDTIGRSVQERFPISSIQIWRIDPKRALLERIAVFGSKANAAEVVATPDITTNISALIASLAAWCAAGEVELIDPADTDYSFADAVGPDNGQSPFLLGPLGITKDKRRSPSLGVVAMSVDGDHRLSEEDKRWLECLLGPLNVAVENDAQMRKLARRQQAADSERRALMFELGKKPPKDTIIGDKGGLSAVMERVDLVARSDAPVLIFGETGTGKEVIARAIHVRSNREEKPFHRVNCGALPPELIDSHLFGHEEGAFTGATETRKGWFERADGGTLFLDEIGDLPAAAQVRLLRILQDGRFERVGGQKPIEVNVRIVAATHRDLAAMVADSTFREDLWYRIAVFPVYLPPLRERREDVPLLAAHFAEKAAVRFGLPLAHPTEADIHIMRSYDWPGNVRELGTVIDRAAILGNGRFLDIQSALGVNVDNGPRNSRPSTSSTATLHSPETAVEKEELESLDTVIRRHIEKVLAATNARIEGPNGAAEILNINPHTLRSRMRKMGIDWKTFRKGNG